MVGDPLMSLINIKKNHTSLFPKMIALEKLLIGLELHIWTDVMQTNISQLLATTNNMLISMRMTTHHINRC